MTCNKRTKVKNQHRCKIQRNGAYNNAIHLDAILEWKIRSLTVESLTMKANYQTQTAKNSPPCLTNKIKNIYFSGNLKKFFSFRPYCTSFWQNTCTGKLKIENSVSVSRDFRHILLDQTTLIFVMVMFFLGNKRNSGKFPLTCLISSYDRVKCNFTSHVHGGLC